MKTPQNIFRPAHTKLFARFLRAHITSAAVTLIIVMCSYAEAQVQRMAIPRGTYRIGNQGSGRATLPSFCIDRGFHAPPLGTSYSDVIAGAGNATVTFPSGEHMTLQKALDEKKLQISGRGGIHELTLSGPPGTIVNVSDPMLLSGDPWLEKSSAHRLTDGKWKKVIDELKSSAGESSYSLQKKIWNSVEGRGTEGNGLSTKEREALRAKFGAEGEKLVQEALQGRKLLGYRLSTVGENPVAQLVSSETEGFVGARKEVIRRDGNKVVRRTADQSEIAWQARNIHARLRSLATDNSAFVAMTADGRLMLARKGSEEPEMFDSFSRNDFAPIEQWLSSSKGPGKPSIVVVTESDYGPAFLTRQLRKTFGERVRIYEDDNPELAAANVKALRPIQSGNDLAVYTDSSIDSGKILAGMDNVFANSSIKLLNKPDVVAAGNIVVVTGHKETSYRNYLAELAMKGALKGKSVALISCGEFGDRQFSRFLIEEGGATCVLRVNEEVDSAAAREVLIKIAQRVKSLPPEGRYLGELLEEAAKAAADDAVGELFKTNIRALLDHSLQVSEFKTQPQ